MAPISIPNLLTLSFLLAELIHAKPASSLSPKDVLNTLERRQSSCPITSPVSCAAVDPKLPSNFCCKTGTSCISLDSSTSALCCPTGATCNTIAPITCDVSVQDPTKNKGEPVFTTRLGDSMPQCGTGTCCPFGYSCTQSSDGQPRCQMVASKSITQLSSSSSASSSSAPAARSSASSSSTTSSTTGSVSASSSTSSALSSASASSIDSTKPPVKSSQSGNPFPPTVFLAGFFPGIVVGALSVLAWVILTGRHKKSDDNSSTTSSVYRKKPYISGPTAINPQGARTEFLRKSAKSMFSKRNDGQGTPGLPFDNWKIPTPPEPNNVPDQPVGRQIPAGPGARTIPDSNGYSSSAPRNPITPRRQIYGDGAGTGKETIHVYSPTELEIPSAAVAPLRGMNSKGKSRSSGVGSPFVTPNRSAEARAPMQTPGYNYEPRYETLTPARYEGGSSQIRSRTNEQGRPETTFTDMLEAINFPDPMNRQAPRMPEVPNKYARR